METGSTGVSHPIRKEISTRSKAAFVSRHLEAITARQNSFFSGPQRRVNGPRVGCEEPYDVADELSASFPR